MGLNSRRCAADLCSLLLVMVFLLWSLGFQEETLLPVLACMCVLIKTVLSKYILMQKIKREPWLFHPLPFFYDSVSWWSLEMCIKLPVPRELPITYFSMDCLAGGESANILLMDIMTKLNMWYYQSKPRWVDSLCFQQALALNKEKHQKIKASAARKYLEGRRRMRKISWHCKIVCLEKFWNGFLATVGRSLCNCHVGTVLTVLLMYLTKSSLL